MKSRLFQSTICFLIIFLTLYTVHAETIGVEDTFGPQGPIQIPIFLETYFTTVDMFSFTFSYGPDILQYVSCERGPLLENFDEFSASLIEPGQLQISGSDSTGIPPGVNDNMVIIHFNVISYGSCWLVCGNLQYDLLGFEIHPGLFTTCTPEWCWLNRDMPDACEAGVMFDITYTIQGGSATIIQTSETIPAGWVMVAPPWDEHAGDTYTWYSSISSCTVQPPSDAMPGTYTFTGTTVSYHWCNGEVEHAITGDQTVYLENPGMTPTPTPETCIHHGDVNFNGVITAADAQLAFQIAIGAYTPTYEESCAADCDGSGTVTAGDAQLVFMAVMGMSQCEDPLI